MSPLALTLLVVFITFVAIVAIGFLLSRRTAEVNMESLSASAREGTGQRFFEPFKSQPHNGPIDSQRNGFAAERRVDGTLAETMARATPGQITWPSMIDESVGELPVEERLDLVRRLGVVDAEWPIEILRRAIQEERDPRMLDAIVDALIAKRGRDTPR